MDKSSEPIRQQDNKISTDLGEVKTVQELVRIIARLDQLRRERMPNKTVKPGEPIVIGMKTGTLWNKTKNPKRRD